MESDGGRARPGELRPARARRSDLVAAGLLGGGVGVGVASFFPAYLNGASLGSQPAELVAHALPLAGWAVAVLLLVVGSERAGAIAGGLGLGVGVVGLGFNLADVGSAISGGRGGSGLVLSVVEWILAAAGSTVAVLPLLLRPAREEAGRIRPNRRLAGLAVAAGVGAAVLFAPPWDRYVVALTRIGRTTVITAGNAFANPAPVIAGNVLVMVGIVAGVLVALLVRHVRVGAALLAGVVLGLTGQIVSALVQWRAPVPASQFGLNPVSAAAAGFHVGSGFTGFFYGFCACVAVLAVAGVARATAPARSAPALMYVPGPMMLPPSGFEPGPTAVEPVPETPRSEEGPKRTFTPTPHY